MSCLYALVQCKHTAMSLTMSFIYISPLIHKYWTSFGYKICTQNLILQGFSLGFVEPASLDHSHMFGIQLSLFSNDFLLDFSFVVSYSDTLKVLLSIFLPPLLHLLLYLLFVCFFIPSIALSTFLFVFQTPPLVKQILLHLVFWFCVPFALTFLIK